MNQEHAAAEIYACLAFIHACVEASDCTITQCDLLQRPLPVKQLIESADLDAQLLLGRLGAVLDELAPYFVDAIVEDLPICCGYLGWGWEVTVEILTCLVLKDYHGLRAVAKQHPLIRPGLSRVLGIHSLEWMAMDKTENLDRESFDFCQEHPKWNGQRLRRHLKVR